MGGQVFREDSSIMSWPEAIEKTAGLSGRIDSAMTSFNEVQVAVPQTQIDLKSVYPLSQIRDSVTATEGTVTNSEGAFLLTANAHEDADVYLRSVERGRYVAGFDAVAGIALKIPTRPTGNQTIEWGYTDFENGFVVGEDADGLYTAVYRNGEKILVKRRSEWINPLTDEINPANLTVYRIPFRWYGRGPIKLTIATELGRTGEITVADSTSLEDSGPITLDPNQPLSVRIKNNGTESGLTAHVYGRHFYVLGDYRPDVRVTSDTRIAQSVSTTFVPLIAYREKTGLYSTISNRLQDIQLLVASNDLIWQIRLLPDITGGTFVDPPNTNGGVETSLESNISATAITGGLAIYTGLAQSGSGGNPVALASSLPQIDLPPNPGVFALCARSVSGTATVTSVFNVREQW
jgi:hypothetical protein